ncbi:Serine/threonine-protein phosphatase 6 regulatory ankyrin repeat subunit C, partial [Mesitornis unicolor]
LLLKHSADVNARDKHWQTPLHVAAANRATKCVEAIVPLLSTVNVADRTGRTALHHAVHSGHLWARGAGPSGWSRRGCDRSLRPLLLPESPNPAGFALLPQIDEPNSFGNTALHIACYMGQDAVANELVNYGANVNQPNEKGFTPLHFAAVSTNGALCLELLVNNGADVNFQ